VDAYNFDYLIGTYRTGSKKFPSLRISNGIFSINDMAAPNGMVDSDAITLSE
jgi:hypothetical protein